ncbi:unnamed protein product [Sphagnum jensenii]|uniref:Uncharacterized protein n=1 Tax=Sphagnum jensenii TaxID=128206 RepID=A0ABP0W4N5_9BRYO
MTHADGFRQPAGQTEFLGSSSQVVADRNALAIAALQFPFSLCLEFSRPDFFHESVDAVCPRLENQFDSQGDKSRLERERIEAYRRSFDFPDSHRCVPLFEARSRVEETAADRDRGKNCFLCSVRQCYYRKIFGRLSRVRIRQPRGEQTETEKIEAYRSSSSFPHSHR